MMGLLWWMACAPQPAAEPLECANPYTSAPQTWLVSEVRFARREGGVVSGFDLDGGASNACDHDDLVDPAGRAGIDNNFSSLVPVLELTEASAAEELVGQSIAAGELLLTLTLDDVDSWNGDTCVDFSLGRGEGVPLVGTDGIVLDAQTVVRSTTVATVSTAATTEDLQLVASGLTFNLPFDILNASLDFQVTEGAFRVQRRYDGALTGIMAGVIPIRQITELMERDDVGLDEFIPIVESIADIRTETGCDGLSFAFEFEAVPAFISD